MVMKTPKELQPQSPEDLALVGKTIYEEMITWPVDERICASCGGSITDKELKSITYWEADPVEKHWAVSHGPGDCAGAAPPSSQAFGEATGKNVEPTEQQAAKAKAIAQAEAAMEMAMKVEAEAMPLLKAEKAEKAMMGPMPMSPAETAMAAAKSMRKQARKMMAAAKKL